MGITYRYYKVSGHHLEFEGCHKCGELRIDALKKKLVNGKIICLNCASTQKTHAKCSICGVNAPTECHHIYGRTRDETTKICLNCHARITRLQAIIPNLKHTTLFGLLLLLLVGIEYTILTYLEIE